MYDIIPPSPMSWKLCCPPPGRSMSISSGMPRTSSRYFVDACMSEQTWAEWLTFLNGMFFMVSCLPVVEGCSNSPVRRGLNRTLASRRQIWVPRAQRYDSFLLAPKQIKLVL